MSDIITLDSNVFRNQHFIDWLMSSEAPHKSHIFPLISYIEVLVWYEMRGLTREDLDKDLRKINTEIIEFPIEFVDSLMKNIRMNPSFPFRHHARDFIIGTIVKKKETLLLTNNKKHFSWLPQGSVLTPAEFLAQKVDLKRNRKN